MGRSAGALELELDELAELWRTDRDSSSVRAGASPSQNGTEGEAAGGVDDPDRAGLHPSDAPGVTAEEEDVAGHRLDRQSSFTVPRGSPPARG